MIAGEQSADNHGSAIIDEIKKINKNIQFIGIGVPGILAVKGIPGSDPNQNSAIGDSTAAIAKCCPKGKFAPPCGIVAIPADSPIECIFMASVKPPPHCKSGCRISVAFFSTRSKNACLPW